MTAVLLTCPDTLLCNIGLVVRGALPAVDGAVTQHAHHLQVDVADPADALIAAWRLCTEHDASLMSLVASVEASEMFFEDADPMRRAYAWLRAAAPHAPADDVCFARHFTQLFAWPMPWQIADAQLPAGDIVLWSVSDGRMVAIDREGFTIGRRTTNDFVYPRSYVSGRHLEFRRDSAGWRVHDLHSTSGFSVNDVRGTPSHPVIPGMVIQLARPFALVVVAVR